VDSGGRYPQYFTETGKKKGEYYTAIIDEDGLGNMAIMNPANGKIIRKSEYESKITGLMARGNGRFLFSRSGNYRNVWDANSKYLVASGPYFYQTSFRMIVVHPVLREIAVCFNYYIYFLTGQK
jgi:hypothetical protein